MVPLVLFQLMAKPEPLTVPPKSHMTSGYDRSLVVAAALIGDSKHNRADLKEKLALGIH